MRLMGGQVKLSKLLNINIFTIFQVQLYENLIRKVLYGTVIHKLFPFNKLFSRRFGWLDKERRTKKGNIQERSRHQPIYNHYQIIHEQSRHQPKYYPLPRIYKSNHATSLFITTTRLYMNNHATNQNISTTENIHQQSGHQLVYNHYQEQSRHQLNHNHYREYK